MAPARSTAARTFGPFSLLRHASSFSAPAQPESASAPRAKRALTLDSPPAVLPPGAPSASGSSIAPLPAGLQSLAEGKSTQSSDSALTAPALGLEEDFEPTAAELAAFLEDEEVMLEMQSLPDILGSTPARANPEMVADVDRALSANGLFPGEREKVSSQPAPAVPCISPYDLFRREQQSLQPPGLSKQDREMRLGELLPYSSSPS